MSNINQYFKRQEFACRCGCGFADVSPELITVLTNVREHFNTPVIITSGCRCYQHNRAVRGKPGSKHLSGIAADIKLQGVSPSQVADYLEQQYPDKYGIGRYSTFTHIDVRSNRARW